MRRIALLALIAAVVFPAALPAKGAAHRVGTPFRDAAFAPEMVVVPAGHVTEGSSEAETRREGRTPAFAAFEHPQRDVTIERPFAIGVAHVTRREFAVFAKATARAMGGCVVAVAGVWSDGPNPAYSYTSPGWKQGDDEPVVCVSWDDAVAYAKWLSAKTGATYRLPSEAEWEYAARAGTTTARWWGDDASDMCARANGGDRDYAAVLPSDKSANLSCSDGHAYTSPNRLYPASPWGLRDVYGNAWQWVDDCFTAVPGGHADLPCTARSIRGGSWHSSVSTLRSATRFSLPPGMRSSSLGFRVMRALP